MANTSSNRYEIWVQAHGSNRQEASTRTLVKAKAEAIGLVKAYRRQGAQDATAKVYDMSKNDAQGSQGVVVFTA